MAAGLFPVQTDPLYDTESHDAFASLTPGKVIL